MKYMNLKNSIHKRQSLLVKILLLFIIGLLSLTPFVFADNQTDGLSCNEISVEFSKLENLKVPGVILYKNERFNFYTLEKESIGHLILEKKVITSVGCDIINESTYMVYMKDRETVEDIRNAENPIDEYNKKIKSKDIIIEGATVTKKIKNFFTNFATKIVGWFT